MDSFLCLFDPNGSENAWADSDVEEDSSSSPRQLPPHLPPEPPLGNVEYKLKLVSPSKQRFEHLVTQMKWRLREGQGEAIYEIGVEDSGALAGLGEQEMEQSLETLREMARRLDATTTVLRERAVEGRNGNFKKVAEVLVRKVPDDQHSIDVRVAVLGSADVGKSTLLGVLTQGELDNGRGRARLNMFRHLHEIQSGRTSSISHEILGFDSQGRVINYSESSTTEEICENSSKLITLIDLAGHQKYLKTTIFGLTGYSPHYVMFVLSANAGIAGMTREHLGLAMALEVPLFVVVTKTDLAPLGLLRHTLDSLEAILKAPGCNKVPLRVLNEDDVITAGSNQLKENVVPIFCVSSVTGQGLELVTKFLHVLPPAISAKERERLEQQLCEFQIDETFRVPDVGMVVGGLLTQGVLVEGSNLMIGPFDDGHFVPVTVQSVRRNKAPCRLVRASQSASLGLNVEIPQLRKGMVILHPQIQARACLYFQATIYVLFHATAIYRGFQTTVHIGNVRQTAVIVGIMAAESIQTNQRASVLFRFLKRPEFISPGSRMLFREGRTKGIGKVTQTFPMPISPMQLPLSIAPRTSIIKNNGEGAGHDSVLVTNQNWDEEEEESWAGIDDGEDVEEEEEEDEEDGDEEEDEDSEGILVNGLE